MRYADVSGYIDKGFGSQVGDFRMNITSYLSIVTKLCGRS